MWKKKKDKNMSNGKAFASHYVCQSNAQHSMYTDAVPHILACDRIKMEHLSCIACS
jgi:hypothetical protein